MLGYVDNDEDGIDIDLIIRLRANGVKKVMGSMTGNFPKNLPS